MIRSSSYSTAVVLALLWAPARLHAQVPATDSVTAWLRARAAVAAVGPRLGPAIWPGYRPDTIPVAFMVPGRGVVLVGWPGGLPAGFAPVAAGEGAAGPSGSSVSVAWAATVDPGAASTAAQLGGRMVAQVNPGDAVGAALTGLIAHEAFHVFEQVTNGAGAAVQENTAVLADYPIFDASNERDMALEGLLLASALRSDGARARSLAAQFLAVRESRQRRLDARVAAFERGAELNEGRAEYALVRATEAAGGQAAVPALVARLDTLTRSGRSVRGRFYVTGAAQALLLDRLAGAGWKGELASWGGTLQDALAHAVNYRAPEEALVGDALAAHGGPALESAARTRVQALRARRRALADSLLARPGTLLVLAGDSVGIGICGFDPQNLLAAGDQLFVHTRWLRPCAPGLSGDLNAPTVEDRGRRVLRVVLDPPEAVHVTVGGAPVLLAEGRPLAGVDVRLSAPGAELTVRRALLERRGRELWLTPLRP